MPQKKPGIQNEIATTITNNPQTLLSFCKNSKSKNEEFNKGTGSNGCKINRNILSIDNQVKEKIGTKLSLNGDKLDLKCAFVYS